MLARWLQRKWFTQRRLAPALWPLAPLAGLYSVLAEPVWRERMMADDWRALSPLIYHHVNPYGRIELDMNRRLPLAA